MAKLHELLSVERNVKIQAEQTRTNQIASFDKKRHLYEEKVVTFKPLAENAVAVTEEQSSLQDTVVKSIDWIRSILTPAWDAGYQIDIANTKAFADLIIEGKDTTPLATGIPTTYLMQLEHRLEELRRLVHAIPTLDPAKGFEPDPNHAERGVYRARPTVKERTKKTNKVLVLAPATDKHPAQVQLVPEDVVVGTLETQEWSGMITPALKSDLLANCDKLLRAVNKARARANDVDIPKVDPIADKLMDFVFSPLYAGTKK